MVFGIWYKKWLFLYLSVSFEVWKKMGHYQPLTSNCGCLRRACLCLKGAVKQNQSRKFIYFWSNKSTCSNEIVSEIFFLVERRLLLSGDVELNPGPLPIENSPLLLSRLNQLGLRPLDVGGEGNCFLEPCRINYMVFQIII